VYTGYKRSGDARHAGKVDMMQKQDYDFFVQNMELFYQKYGHKFLAIKNKNVIGVYDDFDNALDYTLKKEKAGTFLIQECYENREKSIHYFQDNVMIGATA
jgi:fibrillarin-like rRNA methylase